MENPKHPETMSQEELNLHLHSLSDEELGRTVETYGHRWRAYNNGFSRHQDDNAFLRTGQVIQSHYVNRHGFAAA